ncbi:MAG: hypothetical protein EU529_06280 [Promethearchaeota archaeon]|nr:MAG: hypothetical protein EU529_06280 [Candidatus Lokiarchaeota archaeon]
MSEKRKWIGKCRVEEGLDDEPVVKDFINNYCDDVEVIRKNNRQELEMTKFKPITFSKAVIEYIKKRIRVSNNEFDKYLDYMKDHGINNDKLLKIIFSEKNLDELLRKANIKSGKQNRLQAKRCMTVISLALLKCSNYNDLRNSLHALTGLSNRYIYDVIKKCIPILNSINPSVKINRWLPQKPFEYNLILINKMIKKRGWKLLFPKTQEEFDKLRKKHNREPARIPLYVECDRDHKFSTNAFNLQRREKGCRKCADDDKIKYNMDTIKKLVNQKDWILKYPKNQEQLDLLVEKLNCAPNAAPLSIECSLGHPILTKAHRLNQKLLKDTEGCLKCSHIKKRKYNINVVNKMIRDRGAILIYPKTQEHYNALKKSHQCKPFKVPLKIECIRGHIFNSNASLIQQNHWCPYCKQIKSAIGRLTHIIFEYLTIKYLLLKGCQADFEQQINLNTKHQVDILVKRDRNFMKHIEKFQSIISIPNIIREIAIDFTFSLEKKFILSKFYKNYQNKNRFLIVVLLDGDIKKCSVEQIIQFSSNINFKKYIKILSFNEFLEFLCLLQRIIDWRLISKDEKGILSEFNNIYNLAIDAIDSEEELKKLIKIGEKFKNKIGNL